MATAVKVLTAASLLTSPNFDRFNRFPLSATATDRSGSRHVLSQGALPVMATRGHLLRLRTRLEPESNCRPRPQLPTHAFGQWPPPIPQDLPVKVHTPFPLRVYRCCAIVLHPLSPRLISLSSNRSSR
ncbi:hypothetical protein QR680_002908 [Steinernema hermaphroditum]|uniref:Uncharacterized protein n=1 Tax=Steinernema hermaphroditum TaxID=289476 RepID=A0AA39LJ78_9BILA|nr:hypothetical protein QR680_002908 [Steinernema hermaphroditum]